MIATIAGIIIGLASILLWAVCAMAKIDESCHPELREPETNKER